MSTIHPTALIDPDAKIEEGAIIGPYCIVEKNVSIGSGTVLESSVRINANVQIGKNNFFGHTCHFGGEPQIIGFDSGIQSGLVVGDDNIFRENVIIHRASVQGNNTIIGNNNYLMGQTHLGHDIVAQDNIVIVQGTVIAGHVTIGDSAFFGGLAAIHQNVRIGAFSMIAGCCKVVQDVPPYSTIDGNPATVIGINAVGLKRGGFDPEQRKIIKNVYKTIYHSSLNRKQAIEKLQAEPEQDESKTQIIDFFQSSARGVTSHR